MLRIDVSGPVKSGKTTELLRIAVELTNLGKKVVLVNKDESFRQLADRFRRMGGLPSQNFAVVRDLDSTEGTLEDSHDFLLTETQLNRSTQPGHRLSMTSGTMEDKVAALRNEVICRIDHGAESNGHLEWVLVSLDLMSQPKKEDTVGITQITEDVRFVVERKVAGRRVGNAELLDQAVIYARQLVAVKAGVSVEQVTINNLRFEDNLIVFDGWTISNKRF